MLWTSNPFSSMLSVKNSLSVIAVITLITVITLTTERNMIMTKKEFTFLSCDKYTKIHVITWIPSSSVKAVLQISHGMVEYIDRYDDFARFLCEHGYLVVGQDHLGHGASVQTNEDHGYFHSHNGNAIVVGDIHKLYNIMKKHFPSVPYFMLGHSMGSFLLRQYLQLYGNNLSGAIIVGTGYQPAPILLSGMLLCRIIAFFKGDRYRSELVNKMAFGSFNRSFQPARTPYDWLSKDSEQVDLYASHPWCTFSFTVNAYYYMFRGMLTLTSSKNRKRIPNTLPILMLSGDMDPVGNFGKGVKQVFHQFQKMNMKDLSLKLYPNDRHEILNETDRLIVYKDILHWLEQHI